MSKVSFDGNARIIYVLPGVTVIDVQVDLYMESKDWNALEDSKYANVFDVTGGEDISESQQAPTYYYLINNWKIVLNTGETVTVGTNLYTKNIDGIIAVVTNDSQISYLNSSAVQVKSDLEKSLSYGEYIVFDTDDGVGGTTYPTGTHKQPSNNLADAIAIANVNGIHTIHLHSDIALTEDVHGFKFIGVTGKEMVICYGVDTGHCYFDNVYIAGTLGGSSGVRAYQSNLTPGLKGVAGAFKECGITGDITLRHADDLPTLFQACFALGLDGTPPTFIIGDDDDIDILSVHIRGFHGSIAIDNVNQPGEKFNIGSNIGAIFINNTCTDGSIKIGGVVKNAITDNSDGTMVDTSLTVPDLSQILGLFNFNDAGDIKATLDGEEVKTDKESRDESKADVSLLPALI